MIEELPLCPCGCGNQVEYKGKKYFKDHFRNPQPKVNIVAIPFEDEEKPQSIIQDMPKYNTEGWNFNETYVLDNEDDLEYNSWHDEDGEFEDCYRESSRTILLRKLKINR